MKKMGLFPLSPLGGKWKEWLLASKILLVFFLVFSLQLSASVVSTKKVNLNLVNASVKKLFEEIEKQTDIGFLYNLDEVKELNNISIDVSNVTVEEVLKSVLKDTDLTYEIDKNVIIIKPKPLTKDKTNLSDQEKQGLIEIRGTVSAESGETLPNATIVEITAEGFRGVSSDKNGNFTIIVTGPESKLQISYVGYKAQIVEVGNQKFIAVVLEASQKDIDEVVVTGIFTKAKESYTGAATKVRAEEIKAFQGQNLVQTLKNIDPAFNISVDNDFGSNPNLLPQFTVRGNSSLPMSVEDYNTGLQTRVNTPLIIMDGFEISLTKLIDYNDEDIESITILKDASSTAIYGSRGANGVVVVRTKEPQAGKLKIRAETSFTMEMPDLTSYDLLNASELLELQRSLGLYEASSPSYHNDKQVKYAARLKDVLEGVNTDWLHYPVHTGISKKYSLRLEGGSEQFRWGASLSSKQAQGAMKGSERDNFNGSTFLSYTYKNVIFRNQLNITTNKSIESPYGSFSTYANMQPYYKPYNEEGKLVEYFTGLTTPEIGNPLYDAMLISKDEKKYTELTNNFSIEWSISSDLRLRGQLGVSKKLSEEDSYLSPEHSSFTTSDTYQTDDGYFRRGRYEYGTGSAVNYEGNLTLSYSKLINDKHQLYTGLNYSMQNSKGYMYYMTFEGFSAISLPFIPNAHQYEQNGVPSGNESTSRRVGFTGNVNYTYDNRFFVDLSYRVDGSSQFGTQNKFAPFWSTGIGWNLHNENFLKNNDLINRFRLKAAYGQTGSQQFSAYQALQTYQYYTGDKYLNRGGSYLMALGNENLKWQTTDQLNVGTEVAIMDNRFNVSFDYYIKKTSSLLSSRDLPLSTGFPSYIENIGEVKNKGYEASLNAYVIRKGDVSWMLGAKLSYNKNEITKLSDAIKTQTEAYKKEDVDISTLFYEGYAQNSIWAVRSLGIDPSTGNELFLDSEGNITDEWEASAKVYCGIDQPPYRGNLNSILRYKNFTLNLSFAYHWGGQVYNQTLLDKVEVTTVTIGSQNVDKRVLSDRWAKPGDLTFFKGFSNDDTYATSRFVMDDKVFELQSVSLQYKLMEAAFLEKCYMQGITFSLNMSDLFYFSSVKRERGTNYPFARRAGLSISVLF